MKHKGIRGATAGLVGLSGTIALAATAIAAVVTIERFSGDLRDYDTAIVSPFDRATARAQLVSRVDGATVVLHVRGIDPAVAGQTFGAHLHNATCATDQPTLSGGHYNHLAHVGLTPVTISDQTEVWLDLTVGVDGAGDSSTAVRFTPEHGNRSVVIHANPTNPATGAAGPRLACLPVEW